MDEDLNHQSFDEHKIIADAVKRAQDDVAKREALDQLVQVPKEEIDIPENLEEVGQHSLREMSGLARLGKATSTFDLGGNDISIRTLTQSEELEILSRLKHFPVDAKSAVYATLCAACSIESVNGEPYFTRMPMGPQDDIYMYKFKEFVKLYPITINGIMAEYNKLKTEQEQKAIFAKKE